MTFVVNGILQTATSLCMGCHRGSMKIIPTKIEGLVIIEPQVFGDTRGFFMETWREACYVDLGIPTMVQDNLSFSQRGILRGLHFQEPYAQGKLVYVVQGSVFDVAVDLRRDSPTFGQWVTIELSSENKQQFYVPPGFAHGFCVTSETALFAYKCTDYYHSEHEHCIIWNDPDLNIPWPTQNPSLSDRDKRGISWKEFISKL